MTRQVITRDPGSQRILKRKSCVNIPHLTSKLYYLLVKIKTRRNAGSNLKSNIRPRCTSKNFFLQMACQTHDRQAMTLGETCCLQISGNGLQTSTVVLAIGTRGRKFCAQWPTYIAFQYVLQCALLCCGNLRAYYGGLVFSVLV